MGLLANCGYRQRKVLESVSDSRPQPARMLSLPTSVSLLLYGLLGVGCAFTNQVIDRTLFSKPEMYYEKLLPDRDLPDIAWTVVERWGVGAGGGAVGGCWSCGCRNIVPLLLLDYSVDEQTSCEFGPCEKTHCVGGSHMDVPGVDTGGSAEETGPGDEVWAPPAGEEAPSFLDKGDENEALQPKKRNDLILEYRATSALAEPVGTQLGRIPDQLRYLNYNVGLTSNSSLQIEAQQFIFFDAVDTSWAKISLARLFATGARADFELGSLSAGDDTGYRIAVAYGWDAGLNLYLTTRVQTSNVEGSWGYQVEIEGEAIFSPTTSGWAKGYSYWGQEDSEASQIGLGLAQYLGRRTGLHAGVYASNAQGTDPVEGAIEVSSTSARLELRHRLSQSNTLLRAAFLQYFDSKDITALGYSVSVEQPVRNGFFGVRYRFYTTSEGYEAGTWMVTAGHKW